MDILNDEQVLELCLLAIQQKPEMVDNFPGEFLTYYVIKLMGGENMSDYEVAIKINELIAGFELNSLVDKGFLAASFDEHGETEYTRTDISLD